MISVKTWLKRLQYAALMPAAMMAAFSVHAAGTLSGTSVENTATVNYTVATIAQDPIESSPTGNSVSGVGNGTPTSFVVDNRVDLLVEEVDGAATQTNPGAVDVLTTFRVTNEGNTAQDYALTAANLTSTDAAVHGNADTDAQMSGFQVFVDDDGNGAYDGTETATFIDSLAPDASVLVFVLADAPLGVTTLDFANIRLTATTHDAGSGAASLTTETATADTAGVDVVFGDGPLAGPHDGLEFADDGYTFATADLLVSKASTVVEDLFNGTTNPKAIPGAFVQYEITLENTGNLGADNIVITDVLPAEVRAAALRLNGGASDIEIQPPTGPSIFCTFTDADADGCDLTGVGASGEGGSLSISPTGGLTIGAAPAPNTATILFQVEIL